MFKKSLCVAIGIVLTATGMVQVAATLAADKTATPKTRRILYNSDGCECMFMKKGRYTPGPIVEADLKAIADELTEPGSQVDTLLVCINAQVTYYPSKVGTMLGSLFSAERRAQVQKDPVGRHLLGNIEGFYARGVDPYAVIISHARERGLEALLSYRMNDAHDNADLRSKFWLEHPECRLGGGAGLDFSQEAVREYTFRIIEEAVHRYDCDGIELDFERFPTYFPKPAGAEEVKKISDLVHRVRTMLDIEGKRRGKRLVLAARVPTSYQECRQIGLDPAIWAKEGWIDFLTVSEMLFVRFDLLVKPWKELIKQVPVYASIECCEGHKPEDRMTAEKYRRAARHLWKDGADGIYLFNFDANRRDFHVDPPYEVLRELGSVK
jgi:hypothetical protein